MMAEPGEKETPVNQTSQFVSTPRVFVDTKELRIFFSALESGLAYLQSIAPRVISKPFNAAVWNFAESIEPLMQDAKKSLGEKPVILNQAHPLFLQIARAANNAGKEVSQAGKERSAIIAHSN